MTIRDASYFPECNPDELLYSLFARYAFATGADREATFCELIGTSVLNPSLTFQTGVGELARRIRMDASLLIDDHTNFRYYTAFELRGRIPALKRLILDRSEGGGRKGGALIPIAREFGVIDRLRLCRTCVDASLERGEEPYWRRTHQLPLVIVCPDHGNVLYETAPFGTAARKRLHRLTAAIAAGATPVAAIRDEDLPRLAALAQDCTVITTGTLPHPMDVDLSRGVLKKRVLDAGYDHGEGRCDWKALDVEAGRLLAWLRQYLPGLFEENGAVGRWLRLAISPQIAKQPRTELTQLAAYAVDALSPLTAAFGIGPWPCRNPLAEHRGKDVVTLVRRERKNRVTIGRFACSCGYEYTRSQGDDGTCTDPSFARFGKMLGPFVAEAVAKGRGITAVAQELKLAPETLRHALRAEGISNPWPVREGDLREKETGRFTALHPQQR